MGRPVDATSGEGSDSNDDAIVHRRFEPGRDSPATAVAETVADLKGAESADLTTM